jgi:hypothetical protein
VLLQRLSDVDDLEARAGHVLPLAVREVIEDEDVVAPGQERVDHVRADEPCAPCHDRPQGVGGYRDHRLCIRDGAFDGRTGQAGAASRSAPPGRRLRM